MKPILLLAFTCLAAVPAMAQTMRPHAHDMMQDTIAPAEPGQSAFAAIAEITAMLQNDPATDWSKVDVAALQSHLADMDQVTLHTIATTEPIPGGARITVKGDGETIASIQRMMLAHAPFLAAATGYAVEATATVDGAQWTVISITADDEVEIRALGFYGLLAIGAHHQTHHFAIAKGDMVH